LPELPEVETVRRVLEERLKGLTITSYQIGRPTFYRPPPRALLDSIVGKRVEAVRRRGKYLILVAGGNEVVMHLGMSGRIVLGGAGPHLRFQMTVEGTVVNFHDARRFGRVGCALPEFGPEPLSADFTPDSLFASLRGRTAPIKAMLLDQAVVAGLGNIYATEALFMAGLRPGRAAKTLTREDCVRLCAKIKEVIALGVKLNGSTLEDSAYLDPLGQPGGFQNHVAVYGRDVGRCGHPLKATRKPISGRTSLYCPVCQR
jgi:formamidopyrimidine-DNA glycosylase